MLDKLTSTHFSAYLNQTFRIHVDPLAPLEAELVEVSELGARTDDGRRAFSIVFCTSQDAVLPQRIYPVEHAEMGQLDLFLVPIGPGKNGMCYEAVFT
jgi:hypothetical protein